MIKLIVLDLDHTSLKEDKTLPPSLVDVIKELIRKGYLVTFATGRAFELAKPYALSAGINAPLILNNGALIKDVYDGQIKHAKLLDKDLKKVILKYIKKDNLPYTFYGEDGFYTNDQNRMDFYTAWNQDHKESLINIIFEQNSYDFMNKDVYKFLTVDYNRQSFKARYRFFKETLDAYVTQSQTEFLDVLPKNTHKGSALNWFKKQYNLTRDNIIVFGDNDNDVEMFKEAALSIAMPNGSSLAKKTAKMIAIADNNHDGVAKTLALLSKDGII